MKMIKDKVIKEIPTNLIPTYVSMGWKEYKSEVKPVRSFSKITEEDKEN